MPTAVPSSAYMAAAPWLAQVISSPIDRRLLENFQTAAKKLAAGYGEWHTDLQCLVAAERARGETAHLFRSLDGGMFFESNLDNDRIYTDRTAAEKVKQALRELCRQDGIGLPAPFYAMLMMDGDSLGHHMGDVEKQPIISEALERFTGAVQEIVRLHSGFLVYAGGDDVLALLPLDQALGCAAELRRRYLQCFAETDVRSTLSGAIVYAHYKMPLTRVLAESHELLDDIAKDQCGRDGVAVRVWVPGTRILEWSRPWRMALEPAADTAADIAADTDSAAAGNQRMTIEVLAEELAREDDEDSFASGFFYRLQGLFELINPRPGEPDDPGLSEDEAVDLMTAEYVVSGIHGGHRPRAATVEPRVRRLLEQCRPTTRLAQVEDLAKWPRSRRLEPDGGLLVRFLARKGMER